MVNIQLSFAQTSFANEKCLFEDLTYNTRLRLISSFFLHFRHAIKVKVPKSRK